MIAQQYCQIYTEKSQTEMARKISMNNWRLGEDEMSI